MRLQGKSDFKSSFFSFLMMILMAGSAIFTSCYNIFENVQPPVYQEENQPGNQTGAGNAGRTQPEPDPIVISGQLIFNGAVPQEVLSSVASDDASDNASSDDASRAAIPTFTSSEIDYFAVATSGTGANAKTANGTFGAAGTADASTFTIALIPGRSWTITCGITVKGSTSESDRIMTAELPVPSDFTSGTTLQFFPAPDMTDSSATGLISLSMIIDSSIKYVDLAANSAFSSGWPSTLTSATIDAGGTTATISASVPVGTYEILMSFSDENHTLLYATTQTFTVCKGLTTRSWTTSGGESPINSSGAFSVTSTKIQNFAATNYYVGDTGAANASPASNTNNGSHKAPFLTLDKALTVVQSLATAADADPTREYTIHICGTVDNSSTTTVPEIGSGLNDKLAKLTLRGIADTEHPPVIQNHNTSGRILNIATTVPVEITGLKITGGKADGNSGVAAYGGGLYLSGTNTNVTLNNGIVEANSATLQGGGVYIANGAKLTMKGTSAAIQDNGLTASGGQGGGVYVAVGGTFLMENGTIARNKASTSGGGVYARGSFTMKNGTITSNARALYSDTLSETSITANVELGNSGTFNLNGGTITSDFSDGWTGAGVCLFASAGGSDETLTFNMTAGSITGITSNQSGIYGNGIVYCGCSGSGSTSTASPMVFNMSGGSITGNTINSNGSGLTAAVCVGKYSTFNITGGEISGNHSQNGGGGVGLSSITGEGAPSFTLGKAGATSTVKIKNNTSGTSNATNNVFLQNGQTITIAGTLSTDSEVGIYKAFSTAPLTSGYASTNNGTTPADIFTSDENYDVIASTVTGSVGEVAFHIDERQIPLTLEAANSSASVSFKNKAGGPVTYRINGGELQSIAAGVSKSISLSTGDIVQFFGDNLKYGDSANAACSKISCTADCYVYGNIMSLINSTGYETVDTLSEENTFCYLFQNNTKIKNKTGLELLLPATTLTSSCYYAMFFGCTGLTKAPDLPATTIADRCYAAMFSGCTGFTTAPELPATTMDTSCYSMMFSTCSGLTSAPALPATTLAASCYKSMFKGCSSLTSAPELHAATLATNCYEEMFSSCANLCSVTCLATDISASGCTTNWLADVATSGTFTKAPEMEDWATDSADGIPSGWTVHDRPTPLILEAVSSAATVTFKNKASGPVTYKVNGGAAQTIAAGTTGTISLAAAGDKVEFYGDNAKYGATSEYEASNITCSAKCYVYGNIMSLIDSDDFETLVTLQEDYTFAHLFDTNYYITNKPGSDLLLPATTIKIQSYACMFKNCTSLESAPALPATTLTTACYNGMFNGCSKLTSAPELPATTLTTNCYGAMFYGCVKLETAPILPATTLAKWCYQQMFMGCTLINSVTCLATDISAENCTNDWLRNVAAAGTFTQASGVTWPTGASGIPTGWTGASVPSLENVTVDSASFDGSTTTGSTVVFKTGRNLGTIKSLIVSDHETTQGEYETYCTYGDEAPGDSYGVGAYYPAYNVSWYDAVIYCNLRSIHDGYEEVYSVNGITNPAQWSGIVEGATSKYNAPSTCDWTVEIDDSKNGWRLPYEAEWEYIWREKNLTDSGQHTYCGGESINDLSWNTSNSLGKSHIVKTKGANSLEIYDMCGNVWEWMNDWHSYPIPLTTPITGVCYENASPKNHVTRGGGWRTEAEDLTITSARNRSDNNARFNDLGFRVVRNAETTTTAYPKDSGYVGTKAPDDTKAVGDIVFNDGSAMAYADFTGLSTAVKNEMKKKAIALIFYKGTGLNSGSDTSERTLGVGIKNLVYVTTIAGIEDPADTLAWCTSDAKACDVRITSIICEVSGSGSDISFTGDKNGSDNLEQIAEFLNSQLIENDTGVGENSTKTPEEAAALYPAFYFAKNYKNQLIGSETTSRILTGSDFEDGWYHPSIAEVQYIYKNGIAASKVFDLNAANQALGGTSFLGSNEYNEYGYASSTQESQDSYDSWYSKLKFTTLSPYAGVAGSKAMSGKPTTSDCICAIREF